MYGLWCARPILSSGQWPSRPKPWVARLAALDAHWGFRREFIKPYYDYTYAARSGKGQLMFFPLAPGLYEYYTPVSWKHDERGFLQVNDAGEIKKVSREWIIENLSKPDLESAS